MMTLPREQRAERVQEALKRRNMTRHAATVRLEISRPAMDKLWDGREVELETVERFARGLNLSVNEWRDFWGYPKVQSPSDVLIDEILIRRQAYPHLQITLPEIPGGSGVLTMERVENLLRQLDEAIAAGLVPPKSH